MLFGRDCCTSVPIEFNGKRNLLTLGYHEWFKLLEHFSRFCARHFPLESRSIFAIDTSLFPYMPTKKNIEHIERFPFHLPGAQAHLQISVIFHDPYRTVSIDESRRPREPFMPSTLARKLRNLFRMCLIPKINRPIQAESGIVLRAKAMTVDTTSAVRYGAEAYWSCHNRNYNREWQWLGG